MNEKDRSIEALEIEKEFRFYRENPYYISIIERFDKSKKIFKSFPLNPYDKNKYLKLKDLHNKAQDKISYYNEVLKKTENLLEQLKQDNDLTSFENTINPLLDLKETLESTLEKKYWTDVQRTMVLNVVNNTKEYIDKIDWIQYSESSSFNSPTSFGQFCNTLGESLKKCEIYEDNLDHLKSSLNLIQVNNTRCKSIQKRIERYLLGLSNIDDTLGDIQGFIEEFYRLVKFKNSCIKDRVEAVNIALRDKITEFAQSKEIRELTHHFHRPKNMDLDKLHDRIEKLNFVRDFFDYNDYLLKCIIAHENFLTDFVFLIELNPSGTFQDNFILFINETPDQDIVKNHKSFINVFEKYEYTDYKNEINLLVKKIETRIKESVKQQVRVIPISKPHPDHEKQVFNEEKQEIVKSIQIPIDKNPPKIASKIPKKPCKKVFKFTVSVPKYSLIPSCSSYSNNNSYQQRLVAKPIPNCKPQCEQKISKQDLIKLKTIINVHLQNQLDNIPKRSLKENLIALYQVLGWIKANKSDQLMQSIDFTSMQKLTEKSISSMKSNQEIITMTLSEMVDLKTRYNKALDKVEKNIRNYSLRTLTKFERAIKSDLSQYYEILAEFENTIEDIDTPSYKDNYKKFKNCSPYHTIMNLERCIAKMVKQWELTIQKFSYFEIESMDDIKVFQDGVMKIEKFYENESKPGNINALIFRRDQITKMYQACKPLLVSDKCSINQIRIVNKEILNQFASYFETFPTLQKCYLLSMNRIIDSKIKNRFLNQQLKKLCHIQMENSYE